MRGGSGELHRRRHATEPAEDVLVRTIGDVIVCSPGRAEGMQPLTRGPSGVSCLQPDEAPVGEGPNRLLRADGLYVK